MKKQILLLLLTFTLINGCESQSVKKKPVVAPAAIKTIPEILSKPIINVYVENSGSMDGYVKGTTEFEQAVYSYLSDIKISGLAETFNLNYINSEILFQSDELSDFIDKLEPHSFKLKGGNRGMTDISNILEDVLKETKSSTISIFVSDCVFSPGRNKNAESYLLNQQIGIKDNFATTLKNRDFAAIVYRLKSQFEGVYYNKLDQPKVIQAQRPYYIWLLGNSNYLKELISKVDKNKMKGSGVLDSYAIFKKCEKLNYGIQHGPTMGSFDLIDKNNIKKAKKDPDNNQFMFSVGVNYSSLLLDDNYLTDPDNYIVSDPNYKLEIVKSITGLYTHTMKLHFKSSIITSTHIKIQLINKSPKWVNDFNDDIGMDIKAPGAMDKTYGIKYLIGGVYDAYTLKDNVYSEFIVSVNQ